MYIICYIVIIYAQKCDINCSWWLLLLFFYIVTSHYGYYCGYMVTVSIAVIMFNQQILCLFFIDDEWQF